MVRNNIFQVSLKNARHPSVLVLAGIGRAEHTVDHVIEDKNETRSFFVRADGVEFSICHVAVPSCAIHSLQPFFEILQLILIKLNRIINDPVSYESVKRCSSKNVPSLTVSSSLAPQRRA